MRDLTSAGKQRKNRRRQKMSGTSARTLPVSQQRHRIGGIGTGLRRGAFGEFYIMRKQRASGHRQRSH